MISPVMDWQRDERVGLPEAVYAAAKTTAQLEVILEQALERGARLLMTRLSTHQFEALSDRHRRALDYAPLSGSAVLGRIELPSTARVGIVAAGLGDVAAVEEASRTLAFSGVRADVIADVGVAGLWRLTERLGEIRRYDVVIAAAGMEGALFSVLGGLISAPIIALPTAVGEGVGAGGRVALESALASCAPGLVTVNIGNGFGAAQAALRMVSMSGDRE